MLWQYEYTCLNIKPGGWVFVQCITSHYATIINIVSIYDKMSINLDQAVDSCLIINIVIER